MLTEADKVTLSTVGGGALEEMFQYEVNRVFANVDDVNTDPRKVREITLKLRCVPLPDRSGVSFEAQAASKLAPVKPAMGIMYARKDGRGGFEAVGRDTRQGDMFAGDTDAPASAGTNIITLPRTAGAN